MLRKLHHVGIVTADIEAAIRHYMETFDCPAPKVVSVDKPGIKLRTAMLAIGCEKPSHVQLIEPKIGPGVEELRRGGEGAILEMAFEVEEIESVHDDLSRRGIAPVDLLGRPIDSKFLVASSGNRYFYLPREKMRGTSIEIIQVIPPPEMRENS
jgi:hypothetical protein